jgi:hypothetical protein
MEKVFKVDELRSLILTERAEIMKKEMYKRKRDYLEDYFSRRRTVDTENKCHSNLPDWCWGDCWDMIVSVDGNNVLRIVQTRCYFLPSPIVFVIRPQLDP